VSGDGNPLLDRSGLPDYALVSAEHVQPAMESVLASAAAALDALESDAPVTYDALMPQLEALGEGVSAPWGVVNHLMSVRNSPELREAHEAVMPSVVAFFTRLGQSQPIYKALVAIRQGVVGLN
jgi:oligopeptidase A